MPNTLLNRPVSDYRCPHCKAAPFLIMPQTELEKPARARLSIVHVTHDRDCILGDYKEQVLGMMRHI